MRAETHIMNKSLAFGFWILLSIPVVGGRECDNCFRTFSNGTCRKKTPSCRLLTPRHDCFRQKVIAENTFLYMRTGCTLYCKDVNGGSYIRHINKCCKNADFCNRP